MQLPTEKEINVHDSLDEQKAVEHFLGRSLGEAEALFRENWARYNEDLMWMGRLAFRFYIMAAIRFICSDASKGDCTMAGAIASILAFRLEYESQELEPVATPLAAVCDYVLNNREKFKFEDLYDDDLSRLDTLREQFRAMVE